MYRSHGGPDEEWNLITLCKDHHQHVHRESFPKYFLHAMVRWNISFEMLGFNLHTGEGPLSCLTCERRSENNECLLWEHHVDWDYYCGEWKPRQVP